jgi:hypothetical protein
MIPHMRTTLTLDDDVFLLLGRRQSESGGTFKVGLFSVVLGEITCDDKEYILYKFARLSCDVQNGIKGYPVGGTYCQQY